RGMFRRDYELFLTTEGSEAVSLAAANDVDVIVADQRMPGMTGVEVLEKVRNESPRTVRILLTGYADPAAIQGSINAGEVFRFLSKPCPPAVLRETLTQAVAASRLGGGADLPSKNPDLQQGQPIHQEMDKVLPSSVSPNLTRPDAANAARSVSKVAEARSTPDIASSPTTKPPTEAPTFSAPSVSVSSDTSLRSRKSAASDLEETGRNPSLAESATDPEATGRNLALLERSETVTPVTDEERPSSSESTAQFRQLAASRRTKINARSVGVVVFTVDQAFGESVHRIITNDRQVTLTEALPAVADVLGQREAGVLVTDATADINLLQRMIGALKQHLPELVTIVVSDSRDAEDMINLINYGQVYRYVVKPIDALKLRTDIDAAVLKHLQLLNHPELIQRHQVLDLAQTSATSATLNRFIGKVTRLRGLWSGSTAKSH
ncbi:MAG: response regulator, partial [Pseudomonadota bacterium]